MSDKTATERLRAMLDERGVEWKERKHAMPGSMAIQRETLWGQPTDVANGKQIPHVYHYRATEMGDGRLFLEAQLISPEQAIAATLGPVITGDTSDGYHTFNELYHHRAVMFSVIVRDHANLAWKSKAHHDGTMYDGMFIVGIETPQGQATYHYDIDPYWDMFECKELDRAPKWDGHTPDEAIARIATLGAGTCKPTIYDNGYSAGRLEPGEYYEFWEPACACSECGELIPMRKFCPNCGKRVVE